MQEHRKDVRFQHTRNWNMLLLRKSSQKEEARLVEIISRETSEVGTSSRRRKKSKIAIAASKKNVERNEKVSYVPLS